ncbi:MAG: heparinase II/III-family protein, partial [Armatimonadota bacterium]|nr:heparinase II/III-family protein [Armatimonadota bacterium]
YRQLPARAPSFTSVRLPNAGYLIQRTGWEPTDLYLLLNAVPYGGGHSHPDSLSLDVFGYGSLLLTDSGRENYNHPLHREYFRKTRAHNVLQIDGLEQPHNLATEVVAWRVEPAWEHAAGRVAYAGFQHRRDVLFLKPRAWLVVDHVSGDGRHHLEQWWHFPPGEAAVDAPKLAVRSTRPKGANLEILAAGPNGLQARLDEGWIGFRAGGSVKAPVGVFACEASLPVSLAWLLVPRRTDDTSPASIARVPVSEKGAPVGESRAAAWRVRLGDEYFVAGVAYQPGEFECEGFRWNDAVLVQRLEEGSKAARRDPSLHHGDRPAGDPSSDVFSSAKERGESGPLG